MSNGNYPASPQPIAHHDGSLWSTFDDNEKLSGLTKREHFAGLAMQALIQSESDIVDSERACRAVNYADDLLKALESSN